MYVLMIIEFSIIATTIKSTGMDRIAYQNALHLSSFNLRLQSSHEFTVELIPMFLKASEIEDINIY